MLLATNVQGLAADSVMPKGRTGDMAVELVELVWADGDPKLAPHARALLISLS